MHHKYIASIKCVMMYRQQEKNFGDQHDVKDPFSRRIANWCRQPFTTNNLSITYVYK